MAVGAAIGTPAGTTETIPPAAGEVTTRRLGVAAATLATDGDDATTPLGETLLTKAAPTDMPISCVSGGAYVIVTGVPIARSPARVPKKLSNFFTPSNS